MLKGCDGDSGATHFSPKNKVYFCVYINYYISKCCVILEKNG